MSHGAVEEWGASQPFLFSVGPEKKVFTVHSALVAQQSPTLAALVNYGMKESLEDYASLPQHNVETSVRFIDYAYTGDFESPMFDISIRPKEDYDGDLLSHAPSDGRSRQGLVLADYYGIDNLMQVCIDKLRELMRYNKETSVIVEAIKFCFVEHALPKLRAAMLEYCAAHLSYLIMDSEFTKLVKKDPTIMLLLTKRFMRLLECETADSTDEQWKEIQGEKKKRMRPRISPSGSQST
ncbi:BTB/POZ fold protein [Akanthomyces lecanii RCEF 1005]|uniref:BTB/POZ fold protein n=1 Tax=Akanthomyces lecanii RCEF 1005 TaxID=1081108 RepID=A0A168H6G3_CORDF|nr:BTB/POZ fold protein [Akanthomyces lecanii RCEF 1005]